MKKAISFFLTAALLCLPVLNACDTRPGGADTSGRLPDETENPDGTDGIPDTTDAPTEPPVSGTAAEADTARDPSKTYRILFIGNSFTYYNKMPTACFAKIAESAGYSVKVESVTNGGHYLWEFASEEDTYGRQVKQKLTSDVKYDIVIVQEQSSCPISSPAKFFDAVRTLHGLISSNGAEMWLYETWSYKDGHSGLDKMGGTMQVMEMKLRAAYTAIAEELDSGIAYAGTALLDANGSTVSELYHTDRKHPSPAGSYTAALTLFGAIFGVDQRTVAFNGGFSEAEASGLKASAYRAVFGEVAVSAEYKTESAGVTNVKNG